MPIEQKKRQERENAIALAIFNLLPPSIGFQAKSEPLKLNLGRRLKWAHVGKDWPKSRSPESPEMTRLRNIKSKLDLKQALWICYIGSGVRMHLLHLQSDESLECACKVQLTEKKVNGQATARKACPEIEFWFRFWFNISIHYSSELASCSAI